MAKPRLFVEMPLALGSKIALEGDGFHYLTRVMRRKLGDEFEIFNGESPSFTARIDALDRRKLIARVIEETAPFLLPPDVILAFAPIKKARTDFIVEKAAELGARAILPMITEFTNSERVRTDRLQRHAIEAAEQCGGNFVPRVHDEMRFAECLAGAADRQIVFCDELAEGGTGLDALAQSRAPATIFIGPEGGFSTSEREALMAKNALRLSLGPRILRADTAAVAALTLWQAHCGDWNARS